MPLDPKVKRFLDALAAGNPKSALEQSVAERRLGLEQLMQLSGPVEPVQGVEHGSIAGPSGHLAIRRYTPLAGAAGPLPGLVYLHGGGLVAGSPSTHDAIARALANAGCCRVISVDYRLAPEAPFPAALEDTLVAVRHVAAHAGDFGIDPRRLGVAGDSAGATLAAAACQMFARAGGPAVALQLLLCPILDHASSTESRRAYARGFLVEQSTLDHDLLHYLPTGVDPADPRVSPSRSVDLSGLPATSIHTAEFDPLRDEGRAYAERLRNAGIPVAHTCHAGMIHLFYGLAGVIPYARKAYEQVGQDIRAVLG